MTWTALLCRYDLNKQLALLTLGYEKDGLTVEPAVKYNVDSQEASPILSLSQKNGADTLKATYDINGEHGSLEWSHKAYKVRLAAFWQPSSRLCS